MVDEIHTYHVKMYYIAEVRATDEDLAKQIAGENAANGAYSAGFEMFAEVESVERRDDIEP